MVCRGRAWPLALAMVQLHIVIIGCMDDGFKLATLGAAEKQNLMTISNPRSFRGDASQPGILADALKARAAGGELILLSDARLEAAAHAYYSLARLGLNNVLWQTSDEER